MAGDRNVGAYLTQHCEGSAGNKHGTRSKKRAAKAQDVREEGRKEKKIRLQLYVKGGDGSDDTIVQ